jgi:hypothetical protein
MSPVARSPSVIVHPVTQDDLHSPGFPDAYLRSISLELTLGAHVFSANHDLTERVIRLGSMQADEEHFSQAVDAVAGITGVQPFCEGMIPYGAVFYMDGKFTRERVLDLQEGYAQQFDAVAVRSMTYDDLPGAYLRNCRLRLHGFPQPRETA